MKNFIFILLMISILIGCKKDEEIISKNGRIDLTRNTPYEARWRFVIALLDSISFDGKPYFNVGFPNTISSYINFGLKSLNSENTVYLRTTEFQDPNGPGFLYCSDTIQVQSWNNDSIICKIAAGAYNDTVGYYSYKFHGRYNNRTKNVEGFIDPLNLAYRCPTCPGMVYYYFYGKVPAMFIPINY
jgi:hypothetical protein